MALGGRRRFLGALAGLMSTPLAHAQPASRSGEAKRLGMLFIEPQPPEQLVYHTIVARLKELGWVEGQNLSIERAYADADHSRLPGLAQDLVRKGMDVIFADDGPSAIALKRATTTTPVVFYGVPSPVEAGLVGSLVRPGGNLTGVATTIAGGDELVIKRVEVLREVVPKATRLAWILTPDINQSVGGGNDLHTAVTLRLEAMTRRIGFQTKFYVPSKSEDFESVFKEILAARTEVLSVGQSALLIKNRQRVVDFASRHSLPAAYFDYTFVEAGGLLSYGPNFAVGWRVSANYIDRIFRGARPADLPVELPSVTKLQVNLRTAKAMGLSVPQAVLLRADRVIE